MRIRKFKVNFLILQLAFLSCGFFRCHQEGLLQPPDMADGLKGVDTRLGTSGILWSQGHVSPAATVPFGMLQLGPDTSTAGASFSSSGYSFTDIEVRGFSHTRYSGTGLFEGGLLRITPSNKSVDFHSFMRSYLPLDHQLETARPGYYSIEFPRDSISVQLTSHKHSGYHRYRFQASDDAYLILEPTSVLSKEGLVKDLKISFDPQKTSLRGQLLQWDGVSGRYDGLPVFFVIQFSHAWEQFRLFDTNRTLAIAELLKDSQSSDLIIPKGRHFLEFKFDNKIKRPIEVKVSLSHTSLEAAEKNFKEEIQDRSFQGSQALAQDLWRSIFSRIKIETHTDKDLIKFYSALYHSFLMPSELNDVPNPQGQSSYLGYDKKIHSANHPYYGNFSLWDTFRTLHPLYNLIAAEEQKNMVESLLLMAEQEGRVPRWGGQAGHSDSMLGFPGHIVIAESYLKGIFFDGNKAFDLMDKIQHPLVRTKNGQECLVEYSSLGYCPLEKGKGSLSYTMEYAYSDYAMALMAQKLGVDGESEFYLRRSHNVLNHWNAAGRIFSPRSKNGSFPSGVRAEDSSYLPLGTGGNSIFEGSLLQWRWYVPYDKNFFLKTVDAQTIDELKSFLSNTNKKLGGMYPGTNYWHGNEPNLHVAYLFNWLNRPDLTQYWVRWIMDHKYNEKVNGIDGEDDAGTLSAWLIWSHLGIFPVAGTTKYLVGSPIVQSAILQLSGEKTLKIKVQTQDPQWVYVAAVSINGKELPGPEFDHSEIAEGGEIIFQMAPTPTSWGIQ